MSTWDVQQPHRACQHLAVLELSGGNVLRGRGADGTHGGVRPRVLLQWGGGGFGGYDVRYEDGSLRHAELRASAGTCAGSELWGEVSEGVVLSRGLGLTDAVPSGVLLWGGRAVSSVGSLQRRVLLLKRRRRSERRRCQTGWELPGAGAVSGGFLLSGGDD